MAHDSASRPSANNRWTSARASCVGLDFAAELGVADGFEQAGEIGAGRQAVADQVGAVHERRRIEPLGRPGEPLAAEWRGRDRRGRRSLRAGRPARRRRRGPARAAVAAKERAGASRIDWQMCEEPGGSLDFRVGVAQAAADDASAVRRRGRSHVGW